LGVDYCRLLSYINCHQNRIVIEFNSKVI
jgi:hypothetical protein